jgi:hypothetical protein
MLIWALAAILAFGPRSVAAADPSSGADKATDVSTPRRGLARVGTRWAREAAREQ